MAMDVGDFRRRWEERGARRRQPDAAESAEPPVVPVIHRSHWRWSVILYFFFGGISAASFVIAAIASLSRRPDLRPIVRAGRYVSFAAMLPCPGFLIWDLGRPERFLHMLRVVKFRSPMSMGSWGLTIFGGFSALLAVIQAAEDRRLGRGRVSRALTRVPTAPIEATGTVPAFFVGGYTGVLLAATAVPIWAKASRWLGPLFLSSAFSTGAAALTLALTAADSDDHETIQPVDFLERIALGTELALVAGTIATLGETARPLREGRTGEIARYGVAATGIAGPLLLSAVNHRLHSRKLRTLGALLTLAGGFGLRYVAIVAGHASADDPEATFAMTRKRSRASDV